MFDYGIDFYSPQSFVDSRGRRIMTGWMSRMDAGQEESCPTRAHGYIHCLSLPRVLTWEDGALRQRPVPELLSLRRFLRTGTALSGSLNAESGHFELVLKRSDPFSPLDLTLRSGTVGIHYDPQSSRFVVTRKNWADGGTQFREIRLGSLTDLDIFSDASAAEIFVNDGQAVFSMRYFTAPENDHIEYAGLVPGEQLEYYAI